MRLWGLMWMLAASTMVLPAQQDVPVGTVLPVMVTRGIALEKAHQGQAIRARVMQDVPLDRGRVVRAGTVVSGAVLSVSEQPGNGGKIVSFSLNRLEDGRNSVLITTDLRALASLVEVNDAQVPKTGADRGTPASAWTTVQVGGDVVYRGGGSVMRGLEKTGDPVNHGVLARVDSNGSCRGRVGEPQAEQALWVFSSDACGAYGFSGTKILHAGRTDPLGQITIASRDSLRAGSGMLIRVIR